MEPKLKFPVVIVKSKNEIRRNEIEMKKEIKSLTEIISRSNKQEETMKKKVALHNLGCKVNAYEVEAMQQLLEEAGYEIVPFEPGADVYLINTCTVTNIADRKSRQMLHKAKKMNPDAIVIAAGCYVQTDEGKLDKDEAVDLILGNNQKGNIVQVLEEYEQQHIRQKHVLKINQTKEYEELAIDHTAEYVRAYIKVQDGCNQFCTYCIIPYARGRVRSRKIAHVMDEVHALASKGYKEVVLTGIHLSSYGVDFPAEEKETLLSLIRAVHEVEGIERIRLGSLEQGIITEEFVQSIAALPKMCPHFHLSLQSGCDSVLKRMNRKYTTQDIREKCKAIREHFQYPALTTDIIVGFPGETEEEFEETRKFLEEIDLYEMHVFKYSIRKGTKAADMKPQINDQIKAKRSNVLLEMSKQHQKEFETKQLGMVKEVLIEEKMHGKDHYYTGHTKEYIKVALYSEEPLENKIVKVKLRQILDDGYVLAEC